MNGIVYGNRPETILRVRDRLSSKVTNHVLLGTWLEVQERRGDWVRVETAGRGPSGWVHSDDVRDKPYLKIFFVDVGQGDGTIVESPRITGTFVWNMRNN
jgi:hypothetical protein